MFFDRYLLTATDTQIGPRGRVENLVIDPGASIRRIAIKSPKWPSGEKG